MPTRKSSRTLIATTCSLSVDPEVRAYGPGAILAVEALHALEPVGQNTRIDPQPVRGRRHRIALLEDRPHHLAFHRQAELQVPDQRTDVRAALQVPVGHGRVDGRAPVVRSEHAVAA